MIEKIDIGGTPEEEMAKHAAMLKPRPNVDIQILPKTNQNEKFVIDTSSWKMKQYRQWLRLATNVDINEIYKIVLTVLVSWTYPYPLTEEGLDELSPKEWRELIEAVSENAAVNFTS